MITLFCRSVKPRTRILKQFSSIVRDERGSESNVAKQVSVFEPVSEDLSHVSSYLRPTFNIAAYANKSEVIKQLIKIGVNLHAIEKKDQNSIAYLAQLDMENLKAHLFFLSDIGVDSNQFGAFLTKNPAFLKEDLETLQFRIDYLKLQKFSNIMIQRVISGNPQWLDHSTEEISKKVLFFKKNFNLNNREVQDLIVSKPTLITHDLTKVELSLFYLRDSWGIEIDNLRQMLLKKPKIFLTGVNRLKDTVDYIFDEIKLPESIVIEHPQLLTCRRKRLRERHEFLRSLNRAQYDPKKPNYVSPSALIENADTFFATEIAKSSINTYNAFIKNFELYKT